MDSNLAMNLDPDGFQENRCLQLNLACVVKMGFRVVRRGEKSRAEQQVLPFKTGDPDFDHIAFAEGFPQEKMRSFLQYRSVRKAFDDLLTMGYDEILLAHNQLSAKWNFFPPNIQPSPEMIDITRRRLERLAEKLETAPPPPKMSTSVHQKNRRRRWILILVFLSGLSSLLWISSVIKENKLRSTDTSHISTQHKRQAVKVASSLKKKPARPNSKKKKARP